MNKGVIGKAAEVGIDIAGYHHPADNYAIRHGLKSHEADAERARGQIPLTAHDIGLIPQTLSDRDAVRHVGQNGAGRDLLLYEKAIGPTDLLCGRGSGEAWLTRHADHV